MEACDKSVTFKTKSSSIAGNGALYKSGLGKLTIENGNLGWSGDIFISSGTVKASGETALGRGAITLRGTTDEKAKNKATLDLGSKAIANAITIDAGHAGVIKSGKNYSGALTINGNLQKGSLVNVAKTAYLNGGTINGTLSGIGTVQIDGIVRLDTSAKLTTNRLLVNNSLTTSTKGLAMNTKASAITIAEGGKLTALGKVSAKDLTLQGGSLSMKNAKPTGLSLKENVSATQATLDLYGGISAIDMALNATTLKNSGEKAQNISLKGSLSLQNGTILDNKGKLTAKGVVSVNSSQLKLGGALSAASLNISDSAITLYDPSGRNKAMSLTSKGDVTLGSGSSLTLSGKLTANNLRVQEGATLSFTSAKWQPITVKNTLTLNGPINLNTSAVLTEGKAVKLFTFKECSPTGDLYDLLGLSDEYCTLTRDAKALTLTVTDMAAWKSAMQDNARVATLSTDEIAVEENDIAAAVAEEVSIAATETDAVLNALADSLAQSSWGTVNASRAFVDTIANRGQNATALGEQGKAAAWVSLIGGSTRMSSDGAHAGADFTLSGAALGMEIQATQRTNLGLAVGNSWGKVSPFAAGHIEQDSTHAALYGVTRYANSLTLSWSAAHSSTENELNGSNWTQDALQLDARVTYSHAVSDRTAITYFAGLQYLTTDGGELDGATKSGSVQNLRGEIGIGASHQLTERTGVYGEVSFVGDMVRHDPTAVLGDYRSRGSNPGRAGLNVNVGATHRLNHHWSLNAAYNLELMQNVTAQSANIGATYQF